ncbi:hypothetical protein AVEN_273847-1 [Araneus ventricosus]|uniref:Uncharacterized protein n=1 Tax=Araneus ventricosus TaxID=182803 RepID=A0A4Y2L398_ARAVE|nr:hypothetical protein AVEN_273847-1 [Araneus ventricosus]
MIICIKFIQYHPTERCRSDYQSLSIKSEKWYRVPYTFGQYHFRVPDTFTYLIQSIMLIQYHPTLSDMLQTCIDCKNLKLYKKFAEGLDEVELESQDPYKQWTKSADGT